MSRIAERFTLLKAKGRKGFIAYVTAGYPDTAGTAEAVQVLEAAGADVIELGIPFSDPMADGPVIQKAATLALQAGITTPKILELVRTIRETSQIPLVIMTYTNTILNMGVEKFVRSFADAGLDGIIVPDLPLEESQLLSQVCRQAGIDLIQLVAPTTPKERLVKICQKAQGFVYCVSNTGVTGVREVDYSQIAPVIEIVRCQTDVPPAIGFGIGSTQGAQQAAKHADAVIVGSAIMQRFMDEGIDSVRTFAKSIRQALDEGV
ncbi:MAG: tryptophan synthase subunit alpha [Sporomusaceae bacterium]|nr:tryptophan synthase subunit alpha [Sporomusaceae bacterium]